VSDKKTATKEKVYEGYFLMDTGFRLHFVVSEDIGGEHFELLCDGGLWPYNQDDIIYLGVDYPNLLADRIAGWSINSRDEE